MWVNLEGGCCLFPLCNFFSSFSYNSCSNPSKSLWSWLQILVIWYVRTFIKSVGSFLSMWGAFVSPTLEMWVLTRLLQERLWGTKSNTINITRRPQWGRTWIRVRGRSLKIHLLENDTTTTSTTKGVCWYRSLENNFGKLYTWFFFLLYKCCSLLSITTMTEFPNSQYCALCRNSMTRFVKARCLQVLQTQKCQVL